MKRRLGGLLSLALGIVFIVGGSLSGTGSGSVGLDTTCGATNTVGGQAPNPCPVGTFDFTEKTAVAGANFAADRKAPAAAPANWTVTITSTNCLDPATGSPVDQTVTVPTGGSKSSGDLYVYQRENNTSLMCQYSYTQTPVAGYTASFDPASPQTFPASQSRNFSLAITLTDTSAAPTSSSSSPPSSTPASSSSAPSSSSSAEPVDTGVVPSSSPATPDAIADTGPKSSVTFTLLLGIALCVLGLVLLFAGRLPWGARRR